MAIINTYGYQTKQSIKMPQKTPVPQLPSLIREKDQVSISNLMANSVPVYFRRSIEPVQISD